MKIFNSYTRKIQEFDPVNEGKVSMYVCGPTPYDEPHMGHGLSQVRFDLIRRYLIFKGYEVNFVTNVTDIDDKMINRANTEGITIKDLTNKVFPIYLNCFNKLNILEPTKTLYATKFVDQVMSMTRILMQKGYAYELSDGIYFNIDKFPDYGKLSGVNLDDLEDGARIDVKDEKINPKDFVLWKFHKDGEPAWRDPLKQLPEGRPGWHMECSAMIYSEFTDTIDIHGGGQDLTFPHHECEIAQSEACFDFKFVNNWMHNGLLNIDGEKMSKSLNNFVTLKTALDSYPPFVLRYFMLSTSYRSPLDLTKENITNASNSLDRLQNCVDRVLSSNGFDSNDDAELDQQIQTLFDGFVNHMDNDFDISGALGFVFNFVTYVNTALDNEKLSKSNLEVIIEKFKELNSVLGFLIMQKSEIPEEVTKLADQRLDAKLNKNYELADSLRDQILELGFEIKDVKGGYEIKKKS